MLACKALQFLPFLSVSVCLSITLFHCLVVFLSSTSVQFTSLLLYIQQVFHIASPSFSVLSCIFECNIAKAVIVCQNMWHLNYSSPSCWFTSYSSFNNFVQKSIMSQNMANPLMSPLQTEFNICTSSFTPLRTSTLVPISS